MELEATIELGDRCVLCRLLNKSDHDIVVRAITPQTDLTILWKESKEIPARIACHAFAMVGRTHVLQPGQFDELRVDLYRDYEFDRPGAYDICFDYCAMHLTFDWEEGVQKPDPIDARSSTVTFIVDPGMVAPGAEKRLRKAQQLWERQYKKWWQFWK